MVKIKSKLTLWVLVARAGQDLLEYTNIVIAALVEEGVCMRKACPFKQLATWSVINANSTLKNTGIVGEGKALSLAKQSLCMAFVFFCYGYSEVQYFCLIPLNNLYFDTRYNFISF